MPRGRSRDRERGRHREYRERSRDIDRYRNSEGADRYRSRRRRESSRRSSSQDSNKRSRRRKTSQIREKGRSRFDLLKEPKVKPKNNEKPKEMESWHDVTLELELRKVLSEPTSKWDIPGTNLRLNPNGVLQPKESFLPVRALYANSIISLHP